MAIPGASFPGGMPGEPSYPSSAPRATGGTRQPKSAKGPKVVRARKDQHHIDAVNRRKAKLHANAMQRYNAAHAGGAAPLPPSDQALIDAAIRSRFGPEEQGLRNQLSQNAMYSAGLGDWYKQATDQIRALQSGANTQAQNTIGQVQSYASQPTLPGNPQDAQAATARNNLNAAFASQIGANATSNSGALDRFMAAMAIQQANQSGQAQLQRMGLYGQQGQLGQQKADYGLTYGSQLASDRQALDIKQGTLDYLTGNAQAGQKKSAAQTAKTTADLKYFTQHGYYPPTGPPKGPSATEQINEAKLAFFNKHGYWPPTGPPKSPKGSGSNSTYSKSKIQGFRASWDFALEKANQLNKAGSYKDKKGKTHVIDVNAAYSGLLDATKDPDIAKAAAYVAFGKEIPPELRHRLAVKGVHPPKRITGRVKGGGPYGTGRMG